MFLKNIFCLVVNDMKIWTIQPLEIWQMIQNTGVYICDPELSSMPDFAFAYDWMAEQMTNLIGEPPTGIVYPVWGWYRLRGKHKKPDLRSERWCYGSGGEDYTCIELEIPDDEVMLSDFDKWHYILNDDYYFFSPDDEWNAQQEIYYATLSDKDKESFKRRNWQGVFEIEQSKNVQATFWSLK